MESLNVFKCVISIGYLKCRKEHLEHSNQILLNSLTYHGLITNSNIPARHYRENTNKIIALICNRANIIALSTSVFCNELFKPIIIRDDITNTSEDIDCVLQHGFVNLIKFLHCLNLLRDRVFLIICSEMPYLTKNKDRVG